MSKRRSTFEDRVLYSREKLDDRGRHWESRTLILVQTEREARLKEVLGTEDSIIYDRQGRPFCGVCGVETDENWEHYDQHTKTQLGFMEALHIIWLRRNQT